MIRSDPFGSFFEVGAAGPPSVGASQGVQIVYQAPGDDEPTSYIAVPGAVPNPVYFEATSAYEVVSGQLHVTFTAYESSDGNTWTQVGSSQTMTGFPLAARGGMSITSATVSRI